VVKLVITNTYVVLDGLFHIQPKIKDILIACNLQVFDTNFKKMEFYWKDYHHFVLRFSPQTTLTFTAWLLNAAGLSGCLETGAVTWWHSHQNLQMRWLSRSVRISAVAAFITSTKAAHLPMPAAFTTACTKISVCRTAPTLWEATAL